MKENAVSEEYKLLLKRLGENVAKARQQKGLTQRDLAEISGKSQTIIAKVERYAPTETSQKLRDGKWRWQSLTRPRGP